MNFYQKSSSQSASDDILDQTDFDNDSEEKVIDIIECKVEPAQKSEKKLSRFQRLRQSSYKLKTKFQGKLDKKKSESVKVVPFELQNQSEPNSFVICDEVKQIDIDKNMSQSQNVIQLRSSAQMSEQITGSDIARLKKLRQQMTVPYTNEELEFLYRMHKQDSFRIENLQNPGKQIGKFNIFKSKKNKLENSFSPLGLSCEHFELFRQMREYLDAEGFVYVSDKQIVRYLKHCDWHLENAIQSVQLCLEIRFEMGSYAPNVSAFSELEAQKCLIYEGSQDVSGRPVIFIALSKVILKGVNIELMNQYVSFVIDTACSRMPAHIDNLLVVVDCHNFGFKNWSKSHFKALLHLLSTVYVQRQYCTCLIRQKKTMNAILKVMNKWIDEKSRAKFKFMGKDYQKQLLSMISHNNLPVVYGGTNKQIDL